jgi:hypothetical protein
MLAVNAICRLIAVLLAAALTGCGTSGFNVSGGSWMKARDSTLGYAFTVSSPIRVTDLGLYDLGNDGLVNPHAVAIWTSTGTQLVQTTIPAGTPGKLIDGYRYLPITPFILAPGTYTIGAYSPDVNSDAFLTVPPISSAYEVSYVGLRSEIEGGFRFPSRDEDENVSEYLHQSGGYFGPNFWFTCGDPTQAPMLCRPRRINPMLTVRETGPIKIRSH